MKTASPTRSSAKGTSTSLLAPPIGDAMELRWDLPSYAKFLRTLGGWARVIMFDGRGSGVSDSPSGEPLPRWERWADDARAVLDAVDSARAVIFGSTDSGPTAILFAASHPSRTRGLILGNTAARFAAAPDYPSGIPAETVALPRQVRRGSMGNRSAWPSMDAPTRLGTRPSGAGSPALNVNRCAPRDASMILRDMRSWTYDKL